MDFRKSLDEAVTFDAGAGDRSVRAGNATDDELFNAFPIEEK